MQEHVMNISEMEHYLMKQGLSWRHGSLKWSGYKDHWYRESQANEKLGCSLTDPMIAAVTPIMTGTGVERMIHQMPKYKMNKK